MCQLSKFVMWKTKGIPVENKDNFKEQFFSLISERIKKARLNNGMNQEILATKLNISRTSVINIETGRHNVNLFMVYEIAFHLNIDVKELIPDMDWFINTLNINQQMDMINVSNLKEPQGIEHSEENIFNTIDLFLKTINKDDETNK
jgi:DNA-binding XRE family transcriptional regulator